jgi:hypothetical protein
MSCRPTTENKTFEQGVITLFPNHFQFCRHSITMMFNVLTLNLFELTYIPNTLLTTALINCIIRVVDLLMAMDRKSPLGMTTTKKFDNSSQL